jgi:nucleotide-binding universal stress UspA family protein
MTEHDASAQPYSIVVGIDYSDTSTLALAEALTVASLRAPSQLHLVQALPSLKPLDAARAILAKAPGSSLDPAALEAQLQTAAQELSDYAVRILGEPGEQQLGDPGLRDVAWFTHLRTSDPTQAICQVAVDVEANLVMVGTHGRKGLERFLLGSVAEGVVRHAPCPVLVVRSLGAEAAVDVPTIQPACPHCVATRRASRGRELWCDEHRQHHDRRHTYRFGQGRSPS